jgi:nucleotide-binding universal stress UspA family protein
MYKNILLPTDGSELSEMAIRSGVRLAKSLNAKVTGLYVIVESQVAAGIGKSMRDEGARTETAKAYLDLINREAKQHGVAHESFYVVGTSPSEEIIRAAGTKGCDLIFMASHGRRGIAGMLPGSETMHVLTHCRIPVLVYR